MDATIATPDAAVGSPKIPLEDDTPMPDVETPQNQEDQAADSDATSDTDSDQSEEDTQTEWLATSRQKRSTAGNRLNALLQQAQTEEDPEDELALLFAEDENAHEDGGFSDQAGHDSDVHMDSSSDSENSAAEDELEGEKALQKQEREDKQKKKRKLQDKIPMFKKRVKIDPTAIRQPTAPRPKKKSERVSWIPAVEDKPTRASRRETTMQSKEMLHAQMVDRELKRLKVVRNMEKAQAEKEAKKKPAMTQADRLAEAARVEKQNTRSLSRWEESELLREEEQRAKLAALKNRTLEGPVITWWSGKAEWFGGKLRQVGKNLTIEEPKEKGASKKKKAAEAEAGKEDVEKDEAGKKEEGKQNTEKGESNQKEPGKEDVLATGTELKEAKVEGSQTSTSQPKENVDLVAPAAESFPVQSDKPLPDKSSIPTTGAPQDPTSEGQPPSASEEAPKSVAEDDIPNSTGDNVPKSSEDNLSKSLTEEAPTKLSEDEVRSPEPSNSKSSPEREAKSPEAVDAEPTTQTKAKSPTPEEELPPPPIVPLQQPLPPRSSVLAPPPGLPIQAPHPPPNFYHHQSQNPPPYVVAAPTLNGSAPVPGLGFGHGFNNSPPTSGLGQSVPPRPQTHSPVPPTTPKPPPSSTPSHQPPPFGFPLGQHHYHYHAQTPPPARPQAQPTPQSQTPLNSQPPTPSFSYPPPTPLVQEVKEEAPPVLEHATKNYLILRNFDETAIKDKNVQMEVIFGRKFQKLPSSRAKHTHPLCPLTSLPARYRDPTTGLPYANAFAFSQLKKLQRGEYKWSALVGAYVGLGVSPTAGVAARGVPGRFRDPKADKEVVVVPGAPVPVTNGPVSLGAALREGPGAVGGVSTASKAMPTPTPASGTATGASQPVAAASGKTG